MLDVSGLRGWAIIDEKVKAEALASEEKAVYNLRLIRKLETRIRHLEAVVYDEGPPPDAGMLENVQ